MWAGKNRVGARLGGWPLCAGSRRRRYFDRLRNHQNENEKSKRQYMVWTYIIIAVILLVAELAYFKIADHFNIIDKPNERSSHSSIVLRGGGMIFTIAVLVWYLWFAIGGERSMAIEYLPFVAGLLLIAGVSFWDDVRSLPDGVRLVVQFVATAVMMVSLKALEVEWFSELGWYW